MSDLVTIPLDEDVARAIILGVAHSANSYNKSWSWWSIDAHEGTQYKYGDVSVILVQRKRSDDFDDSFGSGYAVGEIELVWEISNEGVELSHYRVKGEFSSYGGEDWTDSSFRQVKPTTRTYREYI